MIDSRHVAGVSRCLAMLLVTVGAAGWLGGCSSGLPGWNWPAVGRLSWPLSANEPQTVAQWARQLAAQAPRLGQAEAAEAAQEIRARLPHESVAWNRRELIVALGKLDAPAAVEGLGNAMADPAMEVRQAACEALAERQTPRAIAILGQTLATDANLDVRLAAARALGHHRRPEAVLALAPALDDSDPAVQYRAMLAMRSASGENLGRDVAAWKKYAAGLMMEQGGSDVMVADEGRHGAF